MLLEKQREKARNEKHISLLCLAFRGYGSEFQVWVRSDLGL